MRKSTWLFVLALAVVSVSACNQPPLAPTPVGAAVILSSQGSLTATVNGNQVQLVWSSNASSVDVQRCQPEGLDCRYNTVAQGASGQKTDGPLPSGIYRYRGVANPDLGISTQFGQQDVTIAGG